MKLRKSKRSPHTAPRRLLPAMAWSSQREWIQDEPGSTRLPMPEQVLAAYVAVGLALGVQARGQEALRWIGASLTWWLGFEALLRPIEMARAGRSTLALPVDLLGLEHDGSDRVAVVAVHRPKTRRFGTGVQFALVENPLLVEWLVWWLDGVGASELLFEGPPHDLPRRFGTVGICWTWGGCFARMPPYWRRNSAFQEAQEPW